MRKAVFIKSFACLVGLTMLGGCDDALNIEPVNQLPLDAAYANPTLIEGQVNGMYSSMYNGGSVGSYVPIAADLLASDSLYRFNGTFSTVAQFGQAAVSFDNGTLLQIYNSQYSIIARANLLIANAANAGSTTDQNRVIGEARTMRAMAYFNLVRFWGRQYNAATAATDRAVAIYTEPIPIDDPLSIPQRYQRPRASVQEVYNQIIADLTAAIPLLPVTNRGYQNVERSTFNGRINSRIANALLARVYLQQGNWNAAITAATTVLSGGSTVNTTFLAPYSVEGGNDDASVIWALQQNATNNSAGANQGLPAHWGPRTTYRGDIWFRGSESGSTAYFGGETQTGLNDPKWWDSSSDPRRPQASNPNALRRGNTAQTFNNAAFTTKWGGPAGSAWSASAPRNIPLIRVPEIYLIRAEARLRTGDAAGALADVNAIRTPRGIPALGAVTLEDIFLERTRELYAEGHYLWDKKRFNRPILVSGTTVVPSSDARFIMPIPQRACQTNPSLCQ